MSSRMGVNGVFITWTVKEIEDIRDHMVYFTDGSSVTCHKGTIINNGRGDLACTGTYDGSRGLRIHDASVEGPINISTTRGNVSISQVSDGLIVKAPKGSVAIEHVGQGNKLGFWAKFKKLFSR